MDRQRAEIIDVDGSGIFVAKKILREGFDVSYLSLSDEPGVLKRIARGVYSHDTKRLLTNALKSGSLKEVRDESMMGSSEVVVVSYIRGLSESYSDSDILRIFRKIARNIRSGAALINHGLSAVGFTDEVANVLDVHSPKKIFQDFHLFYLPIPSLTYRNVPVGGRSRPGPKARAIIKGITTGKSAVYGFSFREAELASVIALLKRVAGQAFRCEAYLLCRSYDILPSRVLGIAAGKGVKILNVDVIYSLFVNTMRQLERSQLDRVGIADIAYKLSSIVESDLVGTIKRMGKGGKRIKILIIGRSEPAMLKKLPSRSFSITKITPEKFLERSDWYGREERGFDLVLLATKNKAVKRKANNVFGERVKMVDLSDYVGVGE